MIIFGRVTDFKEVLCFGPKYLKSKQSNYSMHLWYVYETRITVYIKKKDESSFIEEVKTDVNLQWVMIKMKYKNNMYKQTKKKNSN